jgi:hypothetical protein
MSGERSFPRGRVAMMELLTSWREVASQAATLSPDTPEWQQVADEARHRRIELDGLMAETTRGQLAFRQSHRRPRSR